MSEVVGKCDFCINGSHPQTWAPCPHCRRDHHRINWIPSAAGEVALRLEAELAAARAELAKHKPEERKGRCGCADGDEWTYGVYAGDNLICMDFGGCKQSGCPMTNDEGDGPYCGSNDPKPTWLSAVDSDWGIDAWGERHPSFCSECGWELCPDGVARRNADAARVQRVREALDAAFGARGSADYRDGIQTTVLAIRAALDGGGDGE